MKTNVNFYQFRDLIDEAVDEYLGEVYEEDLAGNEAEDEITEQSTILCVGKDLMSVYCWCEYWADYCPNEDGETSVILEKVFPSSEFFHEPINPFEYDSWEVACRFIDLRD